MGPLSPPVGQQRRVQTFAAEKGAKATSRLRSDFGFLQDALFVLSCVGPPLRFGNLCLPKTSSGPLRLPRAHVTCYTASLHLVDFKCASNFGEAQP